MMMFMNRFLLIEKKKESRDMFSDDKKLHKFLKTLEELGLKTSNDTDLKEKMPMLMEILQWELCFILARLFQKNLLKHI